MDCTLCALFVALGITAASSLNATDICLEIYSTIDSIASPNMRLAALLNAAQNCTEKYPELANQFLKKALETASLIPDIYTEFL